MIGFFLWLAAFFFFPNEEKINYFVCFRTAQGGTGNIQITSERPITDIKQIKNIEKYIGLKAFDADTIKVTITGIQKFPL